MAYHVNFFNRNLYRKYPFRASSTMTTLAGVEIPLSLFCGARMSTRVDLLNLYVKQISVSGSVVSVLIAHQDLNTQVDTPVGTLSGNIVGDYQALFLVSSNATASGFLVVGKADSLASIQGVHLLSYANGKIEDSLIVPFVAPVVSSLNGLKGNVTLEGSNISFADSSGNISLSTDDATKIISKADRASKFNNCGVPIIEKINTVSPDDEGNISIFGVEPVAIHITSAGVLIDTGDLTVDQICSKTIKNIPPDDTTDDYYGDVTTVATPEWKGWPQYIP